MRIIITFLSVMFGISKIGAQTTFTVSQDGSSNFATIQSAINAAPDNEATTIYVKNGIYKEHINIGSKQEMSSKVISLIGESADGTIVTSDIGMATGVSFDKTSAINIYANDFYAQDITFENTAGKNGAQALAIYVAGDRQTFYRCQFKGYQDTHRTKKNTRSYFKNCLIEGATDFIYAGGTAWFESCIIRCIGPGYITAPEDITIFNKLGDGHLLRTGFLFNLCTIERANGLPKEQVYLGRPWADKYCGSIFMNCTLNDVIKPAGWSVMGNNNGENSTLAEYNSKDANNNAIDISQRVYWSKQLTEEEYQAISTWEKVDSVFRWRTGNAIVFQPEAIIANHQPTEDYTTLEDTLLAFPTARGFGKFVTGGRGKKVVEVTNLNDNGIGSFRWAVTTEGVKDATIVFRVGGIINLQSDIRAKLTNVTIAGQTAPGDGILIRGGKLNFGGGNNFIIRNIRARLGKKDDGSFIAGGSIGIENARRFIIDHCCFGWSGEENMTIYDNHFSTVQWCIVHEGLYNAGHAKGVRGYGSQWGGSPATYHHNLLAHNDSRSPRFNGASNADQDRCVFMEYFNNVNYNWGRKNSCYGGENEAGIGSTHECNFIGNYYKPGPSTPSGSYFIELSNARSGKTIITPSKWFFSGNVMEKNSSATIDNWKAVNNRTSFSIAQQKSDTLLYPSAFYPNNAMFTYDYNDYRTPTESAEDAYQHVAKHAGTIVRDIIEKRIVEDVVSGTTTFSGTTKTSGGIIDTPNDAEGYIIYNRGTAPNDTDHDGMPDQWEIANGFDPQNPTDGQMVASFEGYTALEIYLNSLMGEHISINRSDIRECSIVTKSKNIEIYNIQGRKIMQSADIKPPFENLPCGVYIARVQNTDKSNRTYKFLKR